jgi:uncharacterized protein YpmB
MKFNFRKVKITHIVIVILTIVACVLYFFVKKNRENFETVQTESSDALKEDEDVKKIVEEKNISQADLDAIMKFI